nr:GIY-YIG nuclease family protein [Sphingobacterium faecale]
MYTVYVLYSPVYDKIYIGYTGNLANRLLSHNKLSTKGWTVQTLGFALSGGIHQ